MNSLPLSIEQEFRIKIFSDQLQFLSHEELQELSVDLFQHSLVQEKLFQEMMSEYMGVSGVMASEEAEIQ